MEKFYLQLLCKDPVTAWFVLASKEPGSDPPVWTGHRDDAQLLWLGLRMQHLLEKPLQEVPQMGHPGLVSATLLWCHSFGDCEKQVMPREYPPAEFQLEQMQLPPSQWYRVEWKVWAVGEFSSQGVSWAAMQQQCTQTLPGHVVKQLPWHCSAQLDSFPWSWLRWTSKRICCLMERWGKAPCGSVMSWNDEVD